MSNPHIQKPCRFSPAEVRGEAVRTGRISGVDHRISIAEEERGSPQRRANRQLGTLPDFAPVPLDETPAEGRMLRRCQGPSALVLGPPRCQTEPPRLGPSTKPPQHAGDQLHVWAWFQDGNTSSRPPVESSPWPSDFLLARLFHCSGAEGTMKAIQRILVPVDYSAASRAVLLSTFELAEQFGAAVEVVHVWPHLQYADASFTEEIHEQIGDQVKKAMRTFIDKIDVPEGVELSYRVQHGSPWEVIVELSGEYDLVVMATHGRKGLKRLMLGSVATRVVSHAQCPVLTLKVSEEEQEAGHHVEEQIAHEMYDAPKRQTPEP